MLAPDPRHPRRSQAEIPLIGLSEFGRPPLSIQGFRATITTISEIAGAIASSVEQQAAATQEIARNIQEAALGTNQVSGNIGGVQQAASDTGTAAALVLASANDLGRQADELRADVGTFLSNIRAA
jgi:methyl-accepting chemotaxis protein